MVIVVGNEHRDTSSNPGRDLVSYPARAEGLVNTVNQVILIQFILLFINIFIVKPKDDKQLLKKFKQP